MVAMADQTEMKALHMFTTGDPARNATFAFFGDPNYFLTDFPSSTCLTCINPAFAWNHGDIQPEIATTWVGYVGPGVRHMGTTERLDRPHRRAPDDADAARAQDDYVHDGRAVVEPLYDWAVPQTLRAHRETLLLLDATYKQLDAPFGLFGMDILKASTAALKSGGAGDDSKYTSLESRISTLTAQRDALAAQIESMLEASEFGGQQLNDRQALSLSLQAGVLLVRAAVLAALG